MNDELIVVYQFHKNKADCNKNFTTIHKKLSEAAIENLGDTWAITLGHYYTRKEANSMIHKAVEAGYCCGVWLP